MTASVLKCIETNKAIMSNFFFQPVLHISSLKINISGVPDTRKEGNVFFNDALNTFYLQLYGVRHMVKYHSDS